MNKLLEKTRRKQNRTEQNIREMAERKRKMNECIIKVDEQECMANKVSKLAKRIRKGWKGKEEYNELQAYLDEFCEGKHSGFFHNVPEKRRQAAIGLMNMIVEERSWAKAIEADPDFLIADGVYTNRYEAENAAKIIRKYVEDCLDVLTELLGW